MARLTKRNEKGVAYMAIADTLPKRQHEIEGSKPVLEALFAMFQKLAYYEDKEETEAARKRALVIGKTKSDAENMIKKINLVGYREILVRGEKSLDALDGIKAEKVFIYSDCGDYAKNIAKAIVANQIDGEIRIIKRTNESEGMIESTRA